MSNATPKDNLVNVYANPGQDDDGGEPIDEQDVLTDEERTKLRQANPQIDDLLAEESDFIDEIWTNLAGEDESDNE